MNCSAAERSILDYRGWWYNVVLSLSRCMNQESAEVEKVQPVSGCDQIGGLSKSEDSKFLRRHPAMRFPLSRPVLVATVSLCLLFCSPVFAGAQEQPDPPSSPPPV